jgi:hypothetical protein
MTQQEFKPGIPLYICSDGTPTIDKRIYDQREASLQRQQDRIARKGSVANTENAGQESGTESDEDRKE